MSCPYSADIPKITKSSGMRYCNLTRARILTNQNRKEKPMLMCSPTAYNAKYTNCPTYRQRAIKELKK